MKRCHLLLAPLLLCSCYVIFTNPVYTQKDLVFDKKLVGRWADSSSAEGWYEFSRRDSLGYALCLADTGGQRAFFDARLFRLDKKLLLDVVPLDSALKLYEGFLILGHGLLLVETLGAERVVLHLVDYERLDSLRKPCVQDLPVGGGSVRVVADSTAGLQAFVRSTMNKGLFAKEALVLKRKKP